MSDYYQDLGIEKTASAEEIKKAYRNMAFKYHPDRNPGDKVAEEKFKKINAAYEVLGDEAKRRNYDLMGQNPYSDYSQNETYQNTYSNTTYDAGETFWEWFNSQQQSQTEGDYQRQNEYKRWEYSSNNSNYSYSSYLRSFIFKILQVLLGVISFRYTVYFFPIGLFISLGIIINGAKGISSSLRGLRRLGKNNRK